MYLSIVSYDLSMGVVMYTRRGCAASGVMADHLARLGIAFRSRDVDRDGLARREWEDLDGQVTPLIVIDSGRIVRGLDRTRFDQLVGLIGC